MSGGVDLIPREVPPLTSMPRRKQNYPKRMKGDDSDSESGEMNDDTMTEDTSPSNSVVENEDLEPKPGVYTGDPGKDENEDESGKEDSVTMETETNADNDVIDYSVKKGNDLVALKRSADSPLDLSLPHRKIPAVQPSPRIPLTNDKLSPFSPFQSNVLNFIPGGFNFPGVGREGDSSRDNLVNMSSLGGYPIDMSLLQYPHAAGLHPSDSFKCVLCQRRCQNFMELSQHIKEHIIPPGLGPLFPSSSIQSQSSPPETSRVPRKLVRGQDVWLGKGVEQTKQILKCMWCGQSFSTLAEMTTHMQKTQHYTNILSQEQVVPWRAQEGKAGSVITCKVCDKVFRTLQELTSHMVQKSHFFDPVQGEAHPKKKLVKEKRRSRSLPVRKLLEIGRRHSQVAGEDKSPRAVCDRCECKLDSMEHLKFCRGRTKLPPRREQGSSEGTVPGKNCEGDKSGELSALENLIEKSFEKTFSEQYRSVNILQKLGLEGSEMLMRNQFPVSSQVPLLSPFSLCKTPHVRTSTPSSVHSHASSPRSSESATPEQFKDKDSSPLSGSSADLRKSPIQTNCPEEEPGQAHPLAALQKLCDQTHKSTKSSALKARAVATGISPSPASEEEGGGAFKCAFCDISLISKTCYQSHLADVHFIKDGALFCKSPSPSKSVPADLEDTPTSKFVKYSELAKQLSSAHCN